MSYNFSTLNDKDFEELTRDVLSTHTGLNFQSFKPGKDGGADLRYSSPIDDDKIVVQVKHFLNSGISKLKSTLKKEEFAKVKKLNPTRYIFVTSLPLNYQNKVDIKLIFAPYINDISDIWGNEDLNNFLRSNHNIVDNHFKLWLSSTAVLKRISNNAIKGRSDFTKEKILKKIKLFVPSTTHETAVKLLNKNNFILITGSPGIGKTTLANMLTYQLLAENFELVYVREIREAEDAYLPEIRQVFYFDDFLGSSTLDLMSSRNADSAINDFVNRIKEDKSKRLILTCRTTLLKQAKEESEQINNSKIEVSKYEVVISSYRDIDKAKILYQHIYYSKLSEQLKDVFFKERFYWKIINHKHYNPRIIEFFTDEDRIQTEIDYRKEVMNYLNNPSKIWEKSYQKQTSKEGKLLLLTLYSLSGRYIVTESYLKEAFEARLNYEVITNNYTKSPTAFKKVINELLDGFINRIHSTEENHTTIKYNFLNPSIEDFLFHYLTENIEECIPILKSAITISQFRDRITTKIESDSKRIYFPSNRNAELLNIFNEKKVTLRGHGASKDISVIYVLLKHFDWQDVRSEVLLVMDLLPPITLYWEDRENLIFILDYISNNSILHEFSFSIEDLLLTMSKDISNSYSIEAFSNLINRHDVYKSVIQNGRESKNEFFIEFEENINNSWQLSFAKLVEEYSDFKAATTKEDLLAVIEKRKQYAERINSYLNLDSSPAVDEYLVDYVSQLKTNHLAQFREETLLKSFDPSNNDEKGDIDRLFNNYSTNSWDDDLPF